MKTHKLLHSVILLTLISTASQANNDNFCQTNSDGFYIGAETTVVDLGKESMKVTNEDKSTRTYKDIEGSHCNIKVGYQHFDNNRIEIYFRDSSIDTKSKEFSTKTYGINYEWAFSSVSTQNLIPYILVGFGAGEASSSKLKSIDNADVGESNLGLGVHYQFNPNMDIQIAYNYTYIGFSDFEDDKTDKVSEIGKNSITLGISYKF